MLGHATSLVVTGDIQRKKFPGVDVGEKKGRSGKE